jgi:hypothetical protein
MAGERRRWWEEMSSPGERLVSGDGCPDFQADVALGSSIDGRRLLLGRE